MLPIILLLAVECIQPASCNNESKTTLVRQDLSTTRLPLSKPWVTAKGQNHSPDVNNYILSFQPKNHWEKSRQRNGWGGGGGGWGRVNPFQINFSATKMILNKQNFQLLTQCLKNPHSKCIPELAKDIFSFTFPCLLFQY